MASSIQRNPLILHAVFPDNSQARHHYQNLPNQLLALQLAKAQLSLLNTGGGIKSVHTSRSYSTTIRWFANALDQLGFKKTLNKLDFQTFSQVVESPYYDRKRKTQIKILLLQFNEENSVILNPDIVSYCHLRSPMPTTESVAPKPYSEAEAKRLEAACKLSIQATEARIKAGRQQVDEADTDSMTKKVSSLLLEQGYLSPQEVSQHLDCRLSYFRKHLQLEGTTWGALCHSLFPSGDDLLPYMLLLGLYTGINPDAILFLSATASKPFGDSKTRINWNKPRGKGNEADTFSNKGQWSPGKLIQRVLDLTAHLRVRADAPRDRLWIVYGVSSSSLPVTTLGPGGMHSGIKRFAIQHQLLDDQEKPLILQRRRLRKTFYARLDKRYHGAVNIIAGVNQTAQVAADHYLAEQQETEVIRQVIEKTQASLVAQAKRSYPSHVVNEIDAQPENETGTAKSLGISIDATKKLLHEDHQDVFAAKCLDFHNSPFGEPGQPCPSAIWECLSCPLAVITPSKLPNLLALLDHMDNAYQQMSTSEWQIRYANSHRAITEHILPKFSDQVITAARAKVTHDSLYLPPEEFQ